MTEHTPEDWRDEEFDAEAAALMAHLDQFIEKNYGQRCPSHEAGCPICDMWEHRDWFGFWLKP